VATTLCACSTQRTGSFYALAEGLDPGEELELADFGG
jgi:hypothetical protein